MTDLTNKDIEFLSNRELVDVLLSLLREIDVVAASGAHRSTTYLAVSAIEGLFGEILKLLRIQPTTVPSGVWPDYPSGKAKGKPKKPADLTLQDREKILQAAKALPPNFEQLYAPVRLFRNYMHPERELKERTPIVQSVGQLALACLNALIEEYASRRFAAMQVWQLMHGLAQVPADDVIQMPQNPRDNVSVLVSELPAQSFREMTFSVLIPPGAVFDLVYSFVSLDQFMAARIEGRERQDGRGRDNGQVLCTKWRAWAMSGRYTNDSEPDPKRRQHTVRVVLDPPGAFSLTVDNVLLALEGGVDWHFVPEYKIGFMTESGPVSIIDLKIQAL